MLQSAQLQLFSCEVKKKRVHTASVWDKFYYVYAFNNTNYNKLCKAMFNNNIQLLTRLASIPEQQATKIVQKKDFHTLRNLCYVLENGMRKPLGDEPHIFRLKTLDKLRQLLVDYYQPEDLLKVQDNASSITNVHNGYIYHEERYNTELYSYEKKTYKGQKFIVKSIELLKVQNKDIATQLKYYIKILRLCRNGYSLEDAIKEREK